MSPLYWIETWGCQMNEHDSEKLAGTLEGLGYRPAASPEAADFVLLNTCAIREKAEEKVYQYLNRLAAAKRARPEMILCVAGCVAQLAGERLRERAPLVDLVLGPRAAPRLPEYLGQIKDRRGIVDTTLYQDSILAGATQVRREPGRVKAFVTVMEGCNKTCSYCVVPSTRGRESSRRRDDLLREVAGLAGEGYREIEFLGQNVNAWCCPETGARLGDLLRAAARAEGIRRIRFTTSHPLHLSSEIIDAMAEVPEVCNFLHLPVQSGSSAILKAMRRGYDRERYLAKVNELRKRIPDLALSTDVIIGFPGEGEVDFQDTLSLVREVGFDQMFSFIFSPRPGTAAALLADDLPGQRKTERLMELQALQREIQLVRNQALIGKEFEVLVDSASRRDAGEWAGRTTCNHVVNFAADGVRIGDFVQLRIAAAGPNSLRGQRIDVEETFAHQEDPKGGGRNLGLA